MTSLQRNRGRLISRSSKRLKPSHSLKTARRAIKPKKVPKGTPAWIKCIPRGLHGSGHLQQRLWRLTSDYVRIRDAHKYKKCIATNVGIQDWNAGQAGHYRAYTSCKGMFKFDPINIHWQTAKSNSWPDSQIWESFATNLRHRYGMSIIDDIDRANRNTLPKITIKLVLADMERKIKMIARLPEQPEYWPRLMKQRTLLATQQSQESPETVVGAPALKEMEI